LPNISSNLVSVRFFSPSFNISNRNLLLDIVVFPPFWIMGALILLSPLRAPSAPTDADTEAAWLPEKTEAEREQIIAQMREVEVKWAIRCLWALAVLVVLGIVAGIAAWAAMRS
jgi:hypothetical protein